jgi:hypothetical protein
VHEPVEVIDRMLLERLDDEDADVVVEYVDPSVFPKRRAGELIDRRGIDDVPGDWTTAASSASTAEAVSASRSASRSVIARRAPFAASRIADARPMPLPAPVTIATLFSSRLKPCLPLSVVSWWKLRRA